MIERKEYLKELIKWQNDDLIKVITGIRRCGKSTLLKLFAEHLRASGVEDEQIISINFEDLKNEELLNYKSLYNHISERLCRGKWTYVLLDEIQNVSEFQKVVDSLYVQENVDIYITGSNAYMLSGKLATLLSGRYVEISMLPFSFKEFYSAISCRGDLALKSVEGAEGLIKNGNINKEDAFLKYLKFGGFPYSAVVVDDEDKVLRYLEGIYNTILVKDVEDRQNNFAGENAKTTDVSLLKSISAYLADVVGNPVSIKGIADYLNSNYRKVSDHTVSDYVNALIEAFIFYPAERFDIQGKELLKTNKKYYIVDVGLRNYLLAKSGLDLGFALENIVFLELKRRGYKVNIGKLGAKEVDFVVQKNGVKEYFQVSANVSDATTFEREISPLKIIKDNYRKSILTLDKFSVGNYDGIEVVNVIDWLLN